MRQEKRQCGTRDLSNLRRVALVLLAALALNSCFCRGPGCLWPSAAPPPKRGAGLWNVRLPSGDMDAKVGYPFEAYVNGACESAIYREAWTYDLTYSGTLPPGVTLGRDRITGIPRERGTFIIQLKLTNSVCNGERKQDHEEQLRIHVTGSGKVSD